MDFLNQDNTFTDMTDSTLNTDSMSGLDYSDPMAANLLDQSAMSFQDGFAPVDQGLTSDAMGQGFHENVVPDAMHSILETPMDNADHLSNLSFNSSLDIPIPLPVTIVDTPHFGDIQCCSINTDACASSSGSGSCGCDD